MLENRAEILETKEGICSVHLQIFKGIIFHFSLIFILDRDPVMLLNLLSTLFALLHFSFIHSINTHKHWG